VNCCYAAIAIEFSASDCYHLAMETLTEADPIFDYELPQPKDRRCLMCKTSFESEGKHNRICRKCKGSSAWREGDFPATY
jgi:DnaJ-class molecular chaperone